MSLPDLVVSLVNAPLLATWGETIEVSWTVTNQGDVAALADWYDGFYLSSDAILDSSDVFVTDRWTAAQTPLAPGAS